MKSDDSIDKQALQWTPQGHRSRGRPTNTWKRDIDKEIWTAGFKYNLRKVEAAAQRHKTELDDIDNGL